MDKKIKLKNLVSALEDIETFESPKEHLEQYQTSPQIAGEMFHYISGKFDNLYEMRIADLGCGTGILGISAAICGCESVTLFDIDEDAIDIAKQNVANMELDDVVQFVLVDIEQIKDWKSLHKKFDMVVTNPPFGIRSKTGADVNNLKSAVSICSGYVYSLHKFSTFDYLKKFYNKNEISEINGFKIEYDLPKSYKFHKKNNKVIEVLCLEAFVGDKEIII